jgi:hypothetical protein
MTAPSPYGQPPAGYGPPGAAGGFAPAGYAAPFAARGKVRNPFIVLLLACVTCGIYGMVWSYKSLAELRAYLTKAEIVPWHILIPILNIVVLLFKLPDWVTEAKQRAGARNPKSAGALLYFLLGWYFITTDLNEIWAAGSIPPGGWQAAPPSPYQGGPAPHG